MQEQAQAIIDTQSVETDKFAPLKPLVNQNSIILVKFNHICYRTKCHQI
jgi:hypothetical protein